MEGTSTSKNQLFAIVLKQFSELFTENSLKVYLDSKANFIKELEQIQHIAQKARKQVIKQSQMFLLKSILPHSFLERHPEEEKLQSMLHELIQKAKIENPESEREEKLSSKQKLIYDGFFKDQHQTISSESVIGSKALLFELEQLLMQQIPKKKAFKMKIDTDKQISLSISQFRQKIDTFAKKSEFFKFMRIGQLQGESQKMRKDDGIKKQSIQINEQKKQMEEKCEEQLSQWPPKQKVVKARHLRRQNPKIDFSKQLKTIKDFEYEPLDKTFNIEIKVLFIIKSITKQIYRDNMKTLSSTASKNEDVIQNLLVLVGDRTGIATIFLKKHPLIREGNTIYIYNVYKAEINGQQQLKTKFVNTKILLSKYNIEKVNHDFNLGTCHDKTEELQDQKIFTKIINLLDDPPYQNVSIKGKIIDLHYDQKKAEIKFTIADETAMVVCILPATFYSVIVGRNLKFFHLRTEFQEGHLVLMKNESTQVDLVYSRKEFDCSMKNISEEVFEEEPEVEQIEKSEKHD